MKKHYFKWLTLALATLPTLATAEGRELPYLCEFNYGTFDSEWLVIDANNDYKTWAINSEEQNGMEGTTAKYTYHSSNAGNDWMLSPTFSLQAGVTYQLSFLVKTASSSYAENLRVTLGKGATVEAQTTVLGEFPELRLGGYAELRTIDITVAESGDYNLGFQCYSEADKFGLIIDNVFLQELRSQPALITEVAIAPAAEGALEATLSWVNPAVDQSGNPLEGELDSLVVYREEEAIATLTQMEKGATVAYTDTTLTEAGIYNYHVVAFNANGALSQGLVEIASPWIGEDTPKAPTDVIVSAADEKLTLNLTAPTEGVHGGWVNTDSLRYTLTRQPDKVVVENYTDGFPYEVTVPTLALYSYTVVAETAAGASEAVTSNAVAAGGAVSVPYLAEFAKEGAFDLFKVIDVDDDGGWEYYSYNNCVVIGGYDPNDWLITPKVTLEAGKNYQFVFYATSSWNNPKSIKVMMGNDDTPEALTTELLDVEVKNGIYTAFTAQFYAAEGGTAYFALHAYAGEGYGDLNLRSIQIDEIEAYPSAVTDLSVTPAAEGALQATVTWVNPTTSTTGSPLTLTAIEVQRNDEVVATFDSPVLGDTMSYVDNAFVEAGNYTYTVVAISGTSESEALTVESDWVGVDTPLAVTDLLLAKDDEGNATLTYTAPTGAIHGGYMDFSQLSYTITRYPDDTVVAENYTEQSYVDSSEKSLAAYSYSVEVVIGESRSESVVSNIVVFGDALTLPYTTDFATESDFAIWSVVDANNDAKSFEYMEAEKCAAYNNYTAPNDWLITPPFEAVAGTYRFDYNLRTGYGNKEEAYEITYGATTNPADHIVVADLTYTSTLYNEFSQEIEIPTDGTWYIGLHLKTDDTWKFFMNHAAITCLTVSGNEQGEAAAPSCKVIADELHLNRVADYLKIVSVTGAVVANTTHQSSCNIAALPAGIYVVMAQIEGETFTWKITK